MEHYSDILRTFEFAEARKPSKIYKSLIHRVERATESILLPLLLEGCNSPKALKSLGPMTSKYIFRPVIHCFKANYLDTPC